MTLSARSVSLRLSGVPILDDVSIEAAPGEVLGLLGPNGAGKSTLLSILAGDRHADSGAVALFGNDPRAWPPGALARVRAVMTQSTHVAFDYTVREVVELARLPHVGHSTLAADHRVVAAALALCDVAHLADRGYPGLSGGEQQRVQAARALAQIWHPTDDAPGRFLMLDEPTASLDLKHQHDLLGAIRRFVAGGAGAVVVLHDINLASAYCDRVALLCRGRLVACGPTAATLDVDRLAEVYGVALTAFDHGSARQFAVRPAAAA